MHSSEPQPGDFIHLLSNGIPSETLTRVRQILSEDPNQELYEVRDSWNQTRIITAASPNHWLEVDI